MTSKAFSEARFLYPEESQEEGSAKTKEEGKYRKETVYDAVAGIYTYTYSTLPQRSALMGFEKVAYPQLASYTGIH